MVGPETVSGRPCVASGVDREQWGVRARSDASSTTGFCGVRGARPCTWCTPCPARARPRLGKVGLASPSSLRRCDQEREGGLFGMVAQPGGE